MEWDLTAPIFFSAIRPLSSCAVAACSFTSTPLTADDIQLERATPALLGALIARLLIAFLMTQSSLEAIGLLVHRLLLGSSRSS